LPILPPALPDCASATAGPITSASHAQSKGIPNRRRMMFRIIIWFPNTACNSGGRTHRQALTAPGDAARLPVLPHPSTAWSENPPKTTGLKPNNGGVWSLQNTLLPGSHIEVTRSRAAIARLSGMDGVTLSMRRGIPGYRNALKDQSPGPGTRCADLTTPHHQVCE
jgi:hypothetical protein